MSRFAMKEGEIGGKACVWSSPRKPRGREPARGSRRRALPKQEKTEEGRGPETGAADDPPRWKEADEPCSGPEDSRGAEKLPKGRTGAAIGREEHLPLKARGASPSSETVSQPGLENTSREAAASEHSKGVSA